MKSSESFVKKLKGATSKVVMFVFVSPGGAAGGFLWRRGTRRDAEEWFSSSECEHQHSSLYCISLVLKPPQPATTSVLYFVMTSCLSIEWLNSLPLSRQQRGHNVPPSHLNKSELETCEATKGDDSFLRCSYTYVSFPIRHTAVTSGEYLYIRGSARRFFYLPTIIITT